MSKLTDPAMYDSGFERLEGERYFTDAWMTEILMRHLDVADIPGVLWESAAGRGDMVRVLQDYCADVFASDIDMSEFDTALCPHMEHDFIEGDFCPELEGIGAIITNPPFKDLAPKFLEKALSYKSVRFVAMLLPTEFPSAKTTRRMELFTKQPFAYEIKMVDRPRWDWWFREPKKGEGTPRKVFSWFVWDREWRGPCTIFWERRERC